MHVCQCTMFSDGTKDVAFITSIIRRAAAALRRPGLKRKQHDEIVQFVQWLDVRRSELLDNDGRALKRQRT